MEVSSCLWSQEIEKSPIPKECLEEEVVVGIDEAGRGPVMGMNSKYIFTCCICSYNNTIFTHFNRFFGIINTYFI